MNKKERKDFAVRIICRKFANKNTMEKLQWSENVILVDADYVDKVAFNLIVNFERMLGRRIPQADIAKWIDCIALDGGLREGDNRVQVVFVYDKTKGKLENFVPAGLDDELNGKAFKDNIGEFLFSSLPVEDMTDNEHLFCDALMHICSQKQVKRVMAVPDAETYYDGVRRALKNVDDDKRVTVFAMQPMSGGNFRQEILGYSLMAALGIHSEELEGCE